MLHSCATITVCDPIVGLVCVHRLNGCEDVVGCTQARYDHHDLIDEIIERVRVQIEPCDKLSSTAGFMQYYSVCGSAGGGLAAASAEALKREFPKVPLFGFNLSPSRQIHNGPIEPYNVVLSQYWLMEHEDLQICLDNESLWDYHARWRRQQPGGANFKDINELVADFAATITSASRFDGPLPMSLSDILTNVVPYPRTHYLLPAMASSERSDGGCGAGAGDAASQLSTLQLWTRMWEPSSFLVKTEPRCAKHYANVTALVGRGQQPSVAHALDAVRYVEASPQLMHTGGFYNPRAAARKFNLSKLSICATPCVEGDPSTSSASSAMLLNCGAAGEILERRTDAFDRLYAKRSHIHWLNTFCSSGEFSLAREEMSALHFEYNYQWSRDLGAWQASAAAAEDE